ncbi:TlpA family protein disulfide reductase [Solibacillus sp. MA9]|uniref:TlpA family protein disulfide reductase n=1 Tax=Solibacillus palustris TaxID=2908203 RepID=A0ABS9U8K8_9BACL|nr:TlpA disulfide reductase family protein [Solibacillus sp. MA9]MCH7320676.1 TlpA family protein disulfide reductase [Solibacillus sp. MA9]
MKKNIGILIVLVLVITMIGTYIKKELDEDKKISEQVMGKEVPLDETIGLEKGNIAPDFTLYNLDGKPLTLSDLKGKRVVLNFWTTWCPPCKAEMPHMQEYYEKYKEEDNVEIVGVNVTYDREKVERVEQFLKSYNITFPIVLEPDGSVTSQYKIITIPTTFMIDTEGRIQKQIIGPLDLETLRDNVTQLN